MIDFRDFLGLVTALAVTIATQSTLCIVPDLALLTHDPSLYSKIFDDHPIMNEVTSGLLFFVVPAFLAVLSGSAVSSVRHRRRNGWLYTLIGVCFYAYLHYEFLFIPHRDTDNGATYVLFTSPQIYLLASGGVLASLLIEYRKGAVKSIPANAGCSS